MKILLHTCCGPCSIYPVDELRRQDHEVMGFYYRHNIHPFQECLRREEALRIYAQSIDFKVIWQEGYELEEFLRAVSYRESNRCAYCYHARLLATAKLAKHGKFQAFSSTLLYSKFQRHDLIKSIGEAVGKQEGVPFYYQDFREGWKEGIERSKAVGMYRQQYCGCIFSERDRFFNAAQGRVNGQLTVDS